MYGQDSQESTGGGSGLAFCISPPVENEDLNRLFAAAWRGHLPRDFQPVLRRSLVYICAFDGPRLVGFVNLAWDGGVHGFILDPTVHPDRQRRGIGRQLVLRAAAEARKHHLEWLHVDFEASLGPFYRSCGFKECPAGLLRVAAD